MPIPLIEAKNLKKYFKTPAGILHAVDDVSFRINAGETLGVVGESGCGKSTLGRTILRLLEATSGEVLYNGENILSYPRPQMKQVRLNMQMIFQDPFTSLNPRLSISSIICRTDQGLRHPSKASRGFGRRCANSWRYVACPTAM